MSVVSVCGRKRASQSRADSRSTTLCRMTLIGLMLASDGRVMSHRRVTNRLVVNKADEQISCISQLAVMPTSQPDDVVTVCPPTSFSPPAADAGGDDDTDAATDDRAKSAHIVSTDARCDVGHSSAVKSMTLSLGSVTSRRSRDCRMRTTGSTSRNCTKPRRRARSAAAVFAFCFVVPTPSNVYKNTSRQLRP